ncbi:hypothetical protein PRZ48_008161 [Zasmidium cellare]|uniref:NAD dependent epimerase/dehydratase n=1 Tax=Zasmidium cellare TaxID=395010 RepID=A0ABR0EFB0_ZASCE|nr:hypothetical protein PRZ48_008161 [Zasmidium cellare]
MPLLLEHQLLSYVPIWILKLIFPLDEQFRHRDRELKVLCLGLGRTGTDSLRNALGELGYNDVAHGWYFMTEENIKTGIQIERLNRAKYSTSSTTSLTAEEFDKVLGHCMATTDLPMASFGIELLKAYPNAKVILNRRSDLDAWHRSQLNTIDKINMDWASWSRQWFDAEAFWIGRMLYWVRRETGFDFARNGKAWYGRHYAAIEEELRREGREWLDWEVRDGWAPICKLLGEEVLEREFPNENASGGFDKRRAEVHGKRVERADRKKRLFAIVLSEVMLAGVVAWGFFSSR